jgi:hypothetical protein
MQDNQRREPTPEQIKELLQASILRNYPNPDRRGCSEEQTLRSVAEKRLPHESPEWQHITHCSPCYQDFLQFRAEVLERRRHRRRRAIVAVGAIAAGALVGAIWLSTTRPAPKVPSDIARKSQPSAAQEKVAKTLTAVLNMQASPTRGPGPPSAVGDLQRLPRGQMAPLLIYLPFGSDAGTYKVDLMQDEGASTSLASFSGQAEIRDGLTVLQVSPDLSRFAPGTYVLSVSREGGQRWTCRFVLS